jgi:hypothetical protein
VAAVPLGPEHNSILALPGRIVVDLVVQQRGLLEQSIGRLPELLRQRPEFGDVGRPQIPCHQVFPQMFKRLRLKMQAPA